jgi:arylsulfatase A-like enzyme
MTHSLCLPLLLLALAVTPLRADDSKLNVLWIIADDHATHSLGTYGNQIVRTPHLDRLAADGIRFDRAYCNSPVCTASRQSFLTGRYPRSLGVTQLQTVLPAEEVTLAHRLHDAGYHTAALGKMHFNSTLPHGFDLRLDQSDHAAYLKQKTRKPLPEGVEVQPPWRPFKDPARTWLNSRCLPAAWDEDMLDTWLAGKAEDYLTEKRDRPFFLMVSFYEPHSPFTFPVEFRGRISPDAVTVPRIGPEDDEQIPAVFRDLTDKEKQGITAAYYTAVEHLDQNVGRVLQALEKSGQADTTLVIYLGDHGYLLGQHGRFEKHCCYEPAVRAPLLVRFPGRVQPGRSTAALTEFVDIAPTVLEACGVAVPKEMQGRSLLPLLASKADRHRDHVISEYSENEEAMLRTERWKLVYGTGKRERQDGYTTGRPLPGRTVKLFDEEKDPDEFVNLADRPDQADRVRAMTRLLAEHMVRTARQPELVPKSDDVHVLLDFCLQPHDVPPPKPK